MIVLKTCPTSILLDPDVPEPKQRFSDVALPQNSLFVVGLPVGDQVSYSDCAVVVLSLF